MTTDGVTIDLSGPGGQTLTLGSAECGGNTDGDTGVTWDWSTFDGWWETPNGDVQQSERSPDGMAFTVGKNLARAMTLTGAARIPDDNPTQLYGAMDLLSGLFNMRRKSGLVVVNTSPAKQAVVRSPSPTKYAMRGNRQVLEFQIPLLAPDPRKYGLTAVEADGTLADGDAGPVDISITNSGDEDTPFVAVINGGWSTSGQLRYLSSDDGATTETAVIPLTGNFLDSATLTLDARTETIVNAAGVNRYDFYDPSVPNAAWFYLKPGVNVVRYSRVGPVGSSSAALTIQDAYI